MRRFRVLGTAAACASLLNAAGAAAAPQTPTQAFAELNAWRAQAGVPVATTLDPSLNSACAAHVNYMMVNHVVMHGEDPNNKAYTPAGDQAGIHSVLFQSSSDAAGPRIFDSGVYHRMALLEPRLRTTGWASSSGYGCMWKDGLDNGAGSPGLVPYPWPANGMTGVPTAMQGAESPDPHADTGTGGTLGYLLSVNWNGPWSQPLAAQTDVTSATVTPDKGSPVDLAVSDKDSSNWWAVRPGFAVLPKAPLPNNTWFTATAAGTVTGDGFAPIPFNISWRFGTGSAPPPPKDPTTPFTPPGGGQAAAGAAGGKVAPARLTAAHARRVGRRIVVQGTVRPAVKGLRVVARLKAGKHVRRDVAREGRSGRFRAVLRAPRRRGPVTVTVLVPSAPGKHAAKLVRLVAA